MLRALSSVFMARSEAGILSSGFTKRARMKIIRRVRSSRRLRRTPKRIQFQRFPPGSRNTKFAWLNMLQRSEPHSRFQM